MKRITLAAVLIFCTAFAAAQKQKPAQTIKYYDWQWKPCKEGDARFAALIFQTDSGWVRRDYFAATEQAQMIGLYNDSACSSKKGLFRYFYPDGKLLSAGRYINNKKDGLWLSYHYNGMMSDSTIYSNGKVTGISLAWYPNGMISDSVEQKENGTMVSVGWFDNGSINHAGMYQNEKKQGKWKYYHSNGNISSEEWYDADVLTDKKYYDEDGTPQPDTTNRDRDAVFKSGMTGWQKFIASKASFPYNYKLSNTNLVTVVVAATINEDGKITDEFLWIPVHPAFDKEVLRAVKKSPEWQPAIRHNRRVKQQIRQPMSFAMEE
jgi:antitoxin component YwqK of YwqJK toxin-antitoxin module